VSPLRAARRGAPILPDLLRAGPMLARCAPGPPPGATPGRPWARPGPSGARRPPTWC